MKLRIIKPPVDTSNCFVTINPTGVMYFSSKAVIMMGLKYYPRIILATDDAGGVYIRPDTSEGSDSFPVKKMSNGKVSTYCAKTSLVFDRLLVIPDKTTRYMLKEIDDETGTWYKLDGLKCKPPHGA